MGPAQHNILFTGSFVYRKFSIPANLTPFCFLFPQKRLTRRFPSNQYQSFKNMKPVSKISLALLFVFLNVCPFLFLSSKAPFPVHAVLCFFFHYFSSPELRQDIVSEGTPAAHIIHVCFEECCGYVSPRGPSARC